MSGYTIDDLTIQPGKRDINGEIVTHTHTVVFAHPLTEEEKHLFTRMIQGFYYTVRFSRQFGDDLVAEPVIEFTRPDEAQYTLRQRGMSGPWKDLLFAMLANFSHEIVGIRQHNGSRTFDPKRESQILRRAAVQPEPALAVHEPRPGYETEPPVPSDTGSPDAQG